MFLAFYRNVTVTDKVIPELWFVYCCVDSVFFKRTTFTAIYQQLNLDAQPFLEVHFFLSFQRIYLYFMEFSRILWKTSV
jgi:hypothetical protein